MSLTGMLKAEDAKVPSKNELSLLLSGELKTEVEGSSDWSLEERPTF